MKILRSVFSNIIAVFMFAIFSYSAHSAVYQAEDYDVFFDTTPGNSGNAYRSEDVDIEGTSDSGGGYNIGWFDATEWLVYQNLNIATSGDYTVKLRVASPSGGSVSVDLNGGSVALGTINVPTTGGWQNWQTISMNTHIDAGTYSLGVFAATGGWNFNWIEVISNGSGDNGGGNNGGGNIGGSCSQWQAGTQYEAGDVVSYNGAYYVAEHSNPGYDPVISTWFWEPTSPCDGGGNGGGDNGGNCTPWQAGTQYEAGDVVSYNGAYYVAEHSNPGYDPVISTWFWEPTSSCDGGGNGGGGGGNDGGGTGFSSILSSAQFNQMFPNRNQFYTYQGFVEAAAFYPAFAGTGDTTTRKREMAAALANFAHETAHLVYIEEIARGEYCSGGSTPCGVCAPGKRYYGRGPIQLSWNFNYCTAGLALGLDLWNNPDQVAQNSTTAWKTALWFWMTQTGAGNMSAHNAMTNGSGFGETIRTINGSLECNGGRPDQVQSRINNYNGFIQILGTTPGNNLGC